MWQLISCISTLVNYFLLENMNNQFFFPTNTGKFLFGGTSFNPFTYGETTRSDTVGLICWWVRLIANIICLKCTPEYQDLCLDFLCVELKASQLIHYPDYYSESPGLISSIVVYTDIFPCIIAVSIVSNHSVPLWVDRKHCQPSHFLHVHYIGLRWKVK